jgi:hydrogenase nickel incorporation protein HypA/HybF
VHELSVTQALLDLALREAEAAGAKRIGALDVRVGALTGIVPDSVAFYFEMLSKGTTAEDAALRFTKVMPTARCRQCGEETTLDAPGDDTPFSHAWLETFAGMVCAACGSDDFELVGGHDFSLVSLEVE